MQKRYVPVMFILLIALVVGAVGYLMPKEEVSEVPIRVLLENTGGAVVFDHAVHADYYGMPCESCHHEIEFATDPAAAEADILACGSCHGADFKSEDYASMHMAEFSTDLQCVTCHHYQFEDSDPDTNFHHEKLTRNMDNCLACHNEVSNPEKLATDPDFMMDFAQASCATCHDESPTDLLGSRMDAFHNSCMGCHEDLGVGPYEDDQCAQCHI